MTAHSNSKLELPISTHAWSSPLLVDNFLIEPHIKRTLYFSFIFDYFSKCLTFDEEDIDFIVVYYFLFSFASYKNGNAVEFGGKNTDCIASFCW